MTDTTVAWQEMVTAALVGTERHLPSLPPLNESLANLLSRLDKSDPQHFLLEGAAVLALYRQAGQLPSLLSIEPIPTCEPESQDRCSPAAASMLTSMLGGTHKELIPEWLSLAASVQKRVPEELLPDLLKWGENNPDQIEHLLPVIGNRGRWLARTIPVGERVSAAVLVETAGLERFESLWQTERKSFRLYLLAHLRQQNPAQARELVQSTWEEEGAEERCAFLETFMTNLGMEDEAFLEAALDDRAKSVRTTAANLLAHLPESGLVGRQQQRVQEYFVWKPGGFLRKDQILVTLPETCDKDMLRDGIESKRARQASGAKADCLAQILECIPPSHWIKAWRKTPEEILEISGGGDWKDLIHHSLIVAAGRHPDPDWAEALLKIYPQHTSLLIGIPPVRRLDFIRNMIRSNPHAGMLLCEGFDEPWSPELTRMVLPHIRDHFLEGKDAYRFITNRTTFLSLGKRINPALRSEVAARLLKKDENNPVWENAVEDLLQILDYRHRMNEELKE